MKHILIPADFSENSKNAIQYAVQLFNETPCHFHLLYVDTEGIKYAEKPVYEMGTNILVEKEPKAIGQKLKDLEAYVLSFSPKNTPHRFTTIREKGYFLNSIRKQIHEKEIDLIVMGTQGASELKEFFLGTRSGDVITKVECDVLVVPNEARYTAFEQVVIPVDFELDYDDATLRKIAEMITSNTVQIKLLYVTKSDIPLLEQVETQQNVLSQRLARMLPNPITFKRVISKKIEDGVRIFAESVKADLIIMVSKDYGLLQKAFLDTTVEEVSFETSIPLLSLQG